MYSNLSLFVCFLFVFDRSVPLLIAYGINRFSHDVAHMCFRLQLVVERVRHVFQENHAIQDTSVRLLEFVL